MSIANKVIGRELTIEFKNWNVNDVVIELAKYVEKGFGLISFQHVHDHDGTSLEVTMVERYSK